MKVLVRLAHNGDALPRYQAGPIDSLVYAGIAPSLIQQGWDRMMFLAAN